MHLAMTTISSISLLLLSNLTNMTLGETDLRRSKIAIMRLSNNCTTTAVRLDQYDSVELTSNTWQIPDTIIQSNSTCVAHFMTGIPDQGICVQSRNLEFKQPGPGISLRFYTSKYGPDRAFSYFYPEFKTWCTEQSIISIELSNVRDFRNENGEYRFSFELTNVTKDSLSKAYHMDSFKECNQSYVLQPGEEIKISAQRYPPPGDLPYSCQLKLSTPSEDEYEELCMMVEEYTHVQECLSTLEVSGFLSPFWPETEVLGCNDTESVLRKKKEVCSSKKALTLNLNRESSSDTGFTFTARVLVKRHPFWKKLSAEESELRGLAFVKGLTFFIATINSLAGILGALLATMFRHPRSFWKNWAESMNAAEKCEAVHYEVTYPEVSGSQVEEITETKSY